MIAVALYVLSAVIVGSAAALAGIFWPSRRTPPATPPAVVERLVRETVVVTLKSGTVAFSGVLWEADERFLVLRGATATERTPAGGVVETPADGEVFLFVADIAYVQRP